MRKNKNHVALCILVLATAAAAPAAAEEEEVTFSGALGLDPAIPNPTGPVPVYVSGYFFFDSTQIASGGLTSLAASAPTVPGGWGDSPDLVDVQFSVGEAGFETVTYADGGKVTIPYAGVFGFSGGLFDQCGSMGDCAGWTAGHQLTLAQFNASSDPWGLIVDGLSGGSDGFSFHGIPQESGAQPDWLTSAGYHFEVHAVSVPEPGAMPLWVLGFAGLGASAWRRRVRALR